MIDTNKPISRRTRQRKGFSLVELMVAAVEGSIVTALVLGIFLASVIVGTSVGNYSDMHAGNKIALSNFESDLRGAMKLTSFTDKGFTAQVYQNFNPLLGTGTLTTVNYTYTQGASGKGTITRNGVPMLSDVLNCSFTYFDRNDTPMSSGNPSKVLLTATLRRGGGPGGANFILRQNTDYLVSAVVVLRTPQ